MFARRPGTAIPQARDRGYNAWRGVGVDVAASLCRGVPERECFHGDPAGAGPWLQACDGKYRCRAAIAPVKR
jgi:hypothetical protein